MKSSKLIPLLLAILAAAVIGGCSTPDNVRSSGNSNDPDPAIRSTAGGGY